MKTIRAQGQEIYLIENPEVFSPSATTILMLDSISIIAGETVCDVGTGTGVLGIMAAKLGAKTVTFVDKDSAALEIANQNIQKNNISDFKLILSELFAGVQGKYDVIIANLPQLPIAPDNEMNIKPKDNGGREKGNALVLQFLGEAKEHLNEKGRIYIPVFGISSKQETMKMVNKIYHSTVIKTKKVQIKSDPVILQNLEHIYRLRDTGYAELFMDGNVQYFKVSILKLVL